MDLIIIPFHDWRKSEKEGFRTRDVHFIKAFEKKTSINKILIVNRPFTDLELLIRRQSKKLKGEPIYKKGKFSITKASEKTYILDYNSSDTIGQLILRHKWFFNKYGDKKLINFIYYAQDLLGLKTPIVISQNIFAHQLLISLEAENKLFDGWDNFLKFPDYKHLKNELNIAYNSTSKHIDNWITNSLENKSIFKEKFRVNSIKVIKNGVNKDFSSNCDSVPEEMKKIPKPIIGYGGKISYLIDSDLVNHLTEENPDFSFVFIGVILDKKNYKKIKKRSNVYFLGDKNYDVYPCYVKNFDVGIIPYKTGEKQHGGDSIKAYEYLRSNIKVIGTKGNGLMDLQKYLHLASDKYEFSKLLRTDSDKKEDFDCDKFSWDSKADTVLKNF